MTAFDAQAALDRDDLERTIETIRTHYRGADSWWVGAAHALVDEIERLWKREAALLDVAEAARDMLATEVTADSEDALRDALARLDWGDK